jgi:hypothetical protein
MPFLISGNLDKIDPSALLKFQKNFGIILSKNQFTKQQYYLIQNSIIYHHDYIQRMTSMSKESLLGFLFILSQFGDVIQSESPQNFIRFSENPYIIEWKRGCFMIPYEILDFFSIEKVFKEQNYLFALLPLLPLKEKKSWIKWLSIDFKGEYEKDLDRELYRELRLLQKPYEGKTLIQEKEFSLHSLWKPGSNRIMDWYYKGLTSFYYSLQELSQIETDPFLRHVIDVIKTGKFILKKDTEKYRERYDYKLVSTIEGSSIQFRESIFKYETEKNEDSEFLFHNI